MKGRRGKRRSKANSKSSEKEKVTPENALSAKDKNGSVRDLAKRFEAAPSSDPSDSQSTLSLGTETTASATTTTTARTSENVESSDQKTTDGGNSPKPSAKVLMAQAAFSGTPTIMEKLPPKRTPVPLGGGGQTG